MMILVTMWNSTTQQESNNQTVTTPSPSPTNIFENDRTTTKILILLLNLIGIYLVAAFSMYVWRTHQKSNNTSNNRGDDTSLKRMNNFLLFSAVLSLCRFILELVESEYDQNELHDLCTALRGIKAILLTVSMVCIYLVLWIRQHGLNKLMDHQLVVNKLARVVSSSVPFLMVSAFTFCTGLFLGSRTYRSSKRGCVLDKSFTWTKLPTVLIFVNTLIFQLILLAMLIYPLAKHQSFIATMTNEQRGHHDVIKRVTLCTITAISCNGMASMVTLIGLQKPYGLYRQILFDFDNCISIVCVCLSFSDWKYRLFPACFRKVEPNSGGKGSLKRVGNDELL